MYIEVSWILRCPNLFLGVQITLALLYYYYCWWEPFTHSFQRTINAILECSRVITTGFSRRLILVVSHRISPHCKLADMIPDPSMELQRDNEVWLIIWSEYYAVGLLEWLLRLNWPFQCHKPKNCIRFLPNTLFHIILDIMHLLRILYSIGQLLWNIFMIAHNTIAQCTWVGLIWMAQKPMWTQ